MSLTAPNYLFPSVVLEFPAYTTATHRITLRSPEFGNTDGVSGLIKPMKMADGSFRTTVRTIRGRDFDMTFNLFCKEDMLQAVEFFKIYNGNYLKFRDEDDDPWVLQLLPSEIEIDHVGRDHWQFSLSGLKFSHGESGSGGEYTPFSGGSF